MQQQQAQSAGTLARFIGIAKAYNTPLYVEKKEVVRS